MNEVLVLVTGNSNNIVKKHTLKSDIDVVKIDEKDLKNIFAVAKDLKKYNKVYVGFLDINYQKFIYFYHLLIFLSSRKGELIDERGKKAKFGIFKLFIKSISFAFELAASLVLLAGFKLYVLNLRRKLN